eukprot:TRINITY_DN3399_c1_g1_i1.p1 TRINITY_DN3399_c1_g1~~TRINITY_DN3399_c1_g1_i1.p1  ORF type:complete len:239 (-),score=50.30 TRINITY_DN3399_c1_g1_i1:79-795(-)
MTSSNENQQGIVLMEDLEGNTFLELSLRRRAIVKDFKNKLYVDIREYYKDKSGDSKPGRKGLFLSPQHFEIFCDAGVQIQNALKDGNTAFELELDPKKFVTISDFRNNFSVDIREFYTKDGNRNPTRKGVNLEKTELDILLKHGQKLLQLVKGEELPDEKTNDTKQNDEETNQNTATDIQNEKLNVEKEMEPENTKNDSENEKSVQKDIKKAKKELKKSKKQSSKQEKNDEEIGRAHV